MEKKEVFDKILVSHDAVLFHMNDNTNGMVNVEFIRSLSDVDGVYCSPKLKFSAFLKFLEKTECRENNYYIEYEDYFDEPKGDSFDFMLKHFATKVFEDKPIDKEKIVGFYRQAYFIRSKAINKERKISTSEESGK